VVGGNDTRSMERPLGRFLGDALVRLDEQDPEFPLHVMSLIECILDDKPYEAPLRHGLIVQEILEGLLKSAETGKETRLRGDGG